MGEGWGVTGEDGGSVSEVVNTGVVVAAADDGWDEDGNGAEDDAGEEVGVDECW